MAAFTLAALESELKNDPATVGYAAAITAGATGALATLINAAGASGTVYRTDVSIHDIVNSITSSDYTTLTQLQFSQLQLLFTGTTTLDASNSNVRAIMTAIVSGLSTGTKNAISALATKASPSRAEVLWGYGTVITIDQIQAAGSGKT